MLLLEGEVVDEQSEMPESRRARSAALAAAEVEVVVVVEAEGGCCVHWAEATQSVDSGTDSE